MIETDVFLTADGIVVCIHDTTVTRTTEATGAVSSYTLAELQQLDAVLVDQVPRASHHDAVK